MLAAILAALEAIPAIANLMTSLLAEIQGLRTEMAAAAKAANAQAIAKAAADTASAQTTDEMKKAADETAAIIRNL